MLLLVASEGGHRRSNNVLPDEEARGVRHGVLGSDGTESVDVLGAQLGAAVLAWPCQPRQARVEELALERPGGVDDLRSVSARCQTGRDHRVGTLAPTPARRRLWH